MSVSKTTTFGIAIAALAAVAIHTGGLRAQASFDATQPAPKVPII